MTLGEHADQQHHGPVDQKCNCSPARYALQADALYVAAIQDHGDGNADSQSGKPQRKAAALGILLANDLLCGGQKNVEACENEAVGSV